jgi:hypothetical protein
MEGMSRPESPPAIHEDYERLYEGFNSLKNENNKSKKEMEIILI